jgi:hypothetical protein
MTAFAMGLRRAAGAHSAKLRVMVCYAMAALPLLLSNPALAFYAEVKPTLKSGADCVGQVSMLAPKLTACTVAGPKMRIWCPNGQMFEGEIERGGGPAAALARSLCNMSQIP